MKQKRKETEVEKPFNELEEIELSEPLGPDKFDRHMRTARQNDTRSRRKILMSQVQSEKQRKEEIRNIKPSVY